MKKFEIKFLEKKTYASYYWKKTLTPAQEEKTETFLEGIYNDYQKQSFQQP